MRNLIKIKLLVFFSVSIVNVMAKQASPCPEILQKFPKECQVFTRYSELKQEYLNKYDVNIENVSFYRSSRPINSDYLSRNAEQSYVPWNLYGKETWAQWEIGDVERKNLNIEIEKRAQLNQDELKGPYLNIRDINELYQKSLSPKKTGLKRYFGFYKEKKNIKEPNQEVIDLMNTYFHMHNSYRKNNNDGEKEALKKYPYNLSPIAFSAFIQKYFISLSTYNDERGIQSRYLQDLILEYFHLPPVYSAGLQDNRVTNYQDYQNQTVKSFDQLLDSLDQCLEKMNKYYHDRNFTFAQFNFCQEMYRTYRENSSQDKKSIESIKKYLTIKQSEKRKVSPLLGNCEDTTISYRLKQLRSVFNKIKDKIKSPFKNSIKKKNERPWGSLSEKEKKEKILEEESTILKEDMNLYAWSDSYFSNLKIRLRANSSLLRNYIADKKNVNSLSLGEDDLRIENNNKWAGCGIYASQNCDDSKFFGRGEPHLLNIRLKAGEKFLDLKDKDTLNKIGKKFEANNILINGKEATKAKIDDYEKELSKGAYPNIAIKYKKENEWLILKNRKKNSILAQDFSKGSYSPVELNEFYFYLTSMENDKEKDDYIEIVIFFKKNLSKMEKKWTNKRLSQLNKLNDPEWTPFGKCIMKTEKGLEILDSEKCEDSPKLENRLVPKIKGDKKYLSTVGGTFVRFFNEKDSKNEMYDSSKFRISKDLKKEIEQFKK